jgi:uncharacterized membrane protein HdeD (DUF308 family)
VPSSPSVRTFAVRHLQMARAVFAALAAIMITFSPDHSAAVGLSVFSGFAIATALVLLVAAWLVYPADHRWPAVVLGVLTLIAGMVGGIAGWRSTTLFFVIVIAWAIATGFFELLSGVLARRSGSEPRADARDAIVVGAITIVLGLGLLLVPGGYALNYYIDEAHQTFTLTGIAIGVGIFGGYAAVIAVYLGIAAFSPRPAPAASVPVTPAPTDGDRG